jgi:hypothetical protein
MSNSNEIIALNKLLSEIKILIGSLSILDKATENKDQVTTATAFDAINFRVREVSKASKALALNVAPKNLDSPTGANSSKNLLNLQIDDILIELSNPMPNVKKLHELLDTQLETLRKMALSEILTLSIE